MSDDKLREAIGYLSKAIDHINTATAQVQHAGDVLIGMSGEGAKPQKRVLFGSPVLGEISNTANPYGDGWFDATGHGTKYDATGKPAYHTGADLNLNSPTLYADAGKSIFAAADGAVVFFGRVAGWQGDVVVVEHALEDCTKVWTRYAHITHSIRATLQGVRRGETIGQIADYNANGPKGDHLHFDIARIDLGKNPGDWPGMDLARVKRDYVDPAEWLRERSRE